LTGKTPVNQSVFQLYRGVKKIMIYKSNHEEEKNNNSVSFSQKRTTIALTLTPKNNIGKI